MGKEQDQEGDERPDIDLVHQSSTNSQQNLNIVPLRQSNHQEQVSPCITTSSAVQNISQGPMAGSAPVPNNNNSNEGVSAEISGETGAFA